LERKVKSSHKYRATVLPFKEEEVGGGGRREGEDVKRNRLWRVIGMNMIQVLSMHV
jgi:hypothetical protein